MEEVRMIGSAEDLISQAQTKTGLSDFGADGWKEGLDRLLESIDIDLVPDPASLERVRSMILGRLINRLRIEDWYRSHSSEAAELTGPLVILGLPRTATTAVQFLLAVGTTFRYPRRWELVAPVPPPDLATEAEDPRRQAALNQAAGASRLSVRHISGVDGPADDGNLLGLDFHNQEIGFPVPTYTRWWRDADLSTTYAYHERVLRLLSSHRPPQRWLVKAPYHNFHVDDMAAHYPNARFVMTHRDPAVLFPSACSTVGDAQQTALPDQPYDPKVLGAFLLEHLVDGIDRAMRARSIIGEERFLDVSQHEMEQDAVAVARRVYEFLGLDLTDETTAEMQTWSEANKRGSRGVHTYSAEEYGLTTGAIRDAFQPYMQRFNIDVEPVADAR
jgi:hypothetical protein